jgi:hypothetical protein
VAAENALLDLILPRFGHVRRLRGVMLEDHDLLGPKLPFEHEVPLAVRWDDDGLDALSPDHPDRVRIGVRDDHPVFRALRRVAVLDGGFAASDERHEKNKRRVQLGTTHHERLLSARLLYSTCLNLCQQDQELVVISPFPPLPARCFPFPIANHAYNNH